MVNDFPIWGKALLLDLRSRRWINKETGKYVNRNLRIVTEGTRITHEFAIFFKDYTDNHALSCKPIGEFYALDGDQYECQKAQRMLPVNLSMLSLKHLQADSEELKTKKISYSDYPKFMHNFSSPQVLR